MAAVRQDRHGWHDRDWWKRHFRTIVFVLGGFYYWDNSYWYPALGYDPNYSYDNDGPIYAYGNLLPDQVIANVQTALTQDGYYSGPVTGSLDPSTRAALANYQGDHGLAFAGYHAMSSLRMECGYRHWGHDIGDEDTPLEAGLGFAVAWGKPGGFLGREALLRQREGGLKRRLVQFALDDPARQLYHDEPIRRDGTIIGRIASGMFGHNLGRALGMGYVTHDGVADPDFIRSGRWEIEIAGAPCPADASLAPFYDPKRERVRM